MTYVGWLEPDDAEPDASRATRPRSTAHAEHVERVVGVDVFAVLAATAAG